MTLRSSEFWGGMFWLALSAFVLWSGHDLGLGRTNDPGSGFLMFGLGVLMMGLSGIVIVSSLREPGAPLSSLWAGTRWQRVMAVVLLLLAYGFLFERVGFVLCSITLLLVLMTFIDRVDLRFGVPLAVLAPFGLWYMISHWLKIQLPAGLLAGWLT
ncbi:MAG: tripartite tricarboxylate transporter TctB family protein [Burkholderiaceae bacterium]|nr:tripartite tricarboxylate transporter TctB family protein [Burkholderiaceae bacterium]